MRRRCYSSPVRPSSALLAFLAVTLVTTASAAQRVPVIDVYTMGPSEVLFQRFGHAAICVTDDKTPRGRCFNYGTTNFDDPVEVVWTFVRGRSKFWVSVTSLAGLLDYYIDLDRTLYRQRLPLAEGEARELAARLDGDLAPDKKYYIYHHFYDNCTTRIRDHVDAVTGGRLKGRTDEVVYGPSYRELAMDGFSSSVALLVGNEILLGSSADVRPTVWAAMFLPDVLRDAIEKNLHAPPEVVNVRQAALPTGDPMAGRWALFGCAAVLAAVAGAAALSRRSWMLRGARFVVALVIGLGALLLDALAILSVLPELRQNELLLVLLPTDLALPFLRGRWLRRYLVARLALLALVAALALAGVLVQPLWAPIAITAAPLAVFLAVELRGLRRAGAVGSPPSERALLGSAVGGGANPHESDRSSS